MKVIDLKTLWKGNYLKTVLIRFMDRDGTIREWEAVGRVDCDGVVVVVPVTSGGDLLFIRQFRPVVGRYVLEFPAGLVHRGEDPHRAGRRELIEETGHDSGSIETLTEGSISTGIDAEKWTVLLARDVREAPEEVIRAHPPDEGESMEVIRVPMDGLYEALDGYSSRGDYVDIKAYGLVELAKRRMGG
jgi:8-oxo-dGTP pyrophosphatase MutT (NUDIX family)